MSRLVVARSRWRVAVAAALVVMATARSSTEWDAVRHVDTGPYRGWARVVSDPRSVARGQRTVLDIGGRRFATMSFGSLRHRVALLEVGEIVRISGERRPLDPVHAERDQVRHVVGRLSLDTMTGLGDERGASPLLRAANRLRSRLGQGAASLGPRRGSLFTGLVVGDDSAQSPEMIERFRRSGLAHLTAVSGQNVAYILMMASPVLSRLRRWIRLVSTVGILVWFSLVTRMEPSVLRAVTMAGLSTFFATIGRPRSSWSILCLTVGGLVLIDPFLVWSVGWWLSVSGCAGLIVLVPRMATPGSEQSRLVNWLAPTCAAQVGVLVVTTLVFGLPSALSIPCNLLAVPVAGIVMLLGVPVALVCSFLPMWCATILMWPLGALVTWVDRVAELGSMWDPPTIVNFVVSASLVAGVTMRLVWVRAMRQRHDHATTVAGE